MPVPRHPEFATTTRRAAVTALAAGAVGAAGGGCRAQAANLQGVLSSGDVWLNTAPLEAGALRGRVALVNFWTYTCINSLRPLPYLRSWASKYADRGLIVIGVHTPEFTFEHEVARVREAVAAQHVSYPVVLDNDFRIWRGFGNEAWPGFYILDGQGRLRHRRMGEGQYDHTERVIQALLQSLHGQPVADAVRPVQGAGAQAAADWTDLASPETYVGYAKASNFASGSVAPDAADDYHKPARLRLNTWALSGRWAVRPEDAELVAAGGGLAFRFHARDLHLVMAPGPTSAPIDFQVRLDGAPPGEDHGEDVAGDGRGRLEQARMYQLVRQRRGVRDRTFEIEFAAPGARAFCFTFG